MALDYASGADTHWGNISQLNGVNKATLAAFIEYDSSSGAWSEPLGERDDDDNGFCIRKYGTDARWYFPCANGANTFGENSSMSLSSGTTYHVLMSYDGTQSTNATKLKVWMDGVEESLSYGGTIPTALGTLTANFMIQAVGVRAEAALWIGQAIRNEGIIDALAAGASPLIFPDGLAFYAPLIRNKHDIVGGRTATDSGSISVVTHPRVTYPAAPLWVPAASAAPPAGTLLRHPGMTGGMKELAGGMRG